MPGLETLKQVLELRQDPLADSQSSVEDIHQNTPKSQNQRVKSYVSTSQEPTLALIRARKTQASSESWSNLSAEDLLELRARFDNYKRELSSQMAQLAPIESMLYDFGDELGRLSGSLKLLQQQLTQLSSNLILQKTTTEHLNTRGERYFREK